MYTKSKNSLLFVVFIIIILLIISILIVAVYNTKQKNLEQYKISLNNVLYDEEYSFVSLDDDAILKKEWDNNFYLYESDNTKHSLGSETVIYDKSIREITIYGTAYQVFSNGDVVELNEKTKISKLDEFQFFKLNDRKYLIIGDKITGPSVSTIDYLIVSIDRAGNASLLNHSVNIKTINPLSLSVGERVFDVANETLIVGEEKIDLKKINGSTNEYVYGENKNGISSSGNNGGSSGNTGSSGNSGLSDSSVLESLEQLLNSENFGSSGNISTNNKVYKEIVNQIITLSGMIPSNTNKSSLYKNVSLRDVSTTSGYLDVYYSIIDPENKYLNVFLAIQKIMHNESDLTEIAKESVNCESEEVECVFLSKDTAHYRKMGLTPGTKYMVSLNYLESGKESSVVADVVSVITDSNPTSLRIVEVNNNVYTYNIKLYSEYAFAEAKVILTDCEGSEISKEPVVLDITNALTAIGVTGSIEQTNTTTSFVCLELSEVKDANGNFITVDSYHKIRSLN